MAKDKKKTVMGKDETGKFHPGKGKPSGINKEEGLGLHPTQPERLEEYLELTDKYTDGSDELAPVVPVRHPNRNTSKGEDNFKGKENHEPTDKTINVLPSEDVTNTVAEELPGILTKEIFIEIANHQSDCCISVFIGTHNAGVEVNEKYDIIQFKNTLQKLEMILKEKNLLQTTIDSMLKPGYELLRNDEFWMQQSPGLAVFISEGYFKYIKMRQSPVEETIVESSFYVTPLLPLMVSKEYFYLLVISKKQAKLFRADAFGMEHIPVEGVPNGIAEEIGDTDVSTTFRNNGHAGTVGANAHGHGGGNNNDDKIYISNYLESVDDAIWKNVLHNENVPLLLAGVEYLIPIYKSVSDYKNIWEVALTGSHEHDNTTDLYKQAREIMEPYFQQRVNKAIEVYGNQSATQLTSSVVDDILPAAYYGRISHLFVQKGQHIWGTFDEMENLVRISNQETEGSQDLIDNAVEKTLLNSGEVFLLDKEQMPDAAEMAAIFRY
jgi:hypothetical protein